MTHHGRNFDGRTDFETTQQTAVTTVSLCYQLLVDKISCYSDILTQVTVIYLRKCGQIIEHQK